jgi:hypothetical protein
MKLVSLKIEVSWGALISPQMPAHKKTMSKVAQSASKKNTIVVSQLDTMPDAVFARIGSNLGSYFRLTCHNGVNTVELLGSPRGLFKQRRAQIRFARDDIVVLSGMPSHASDITEIIALLGKKEAQQLYKDGRIHKSIYQTPPSIGETAPNDDDVFDYTDVVNEEMNIDNL